MILQCKPVQCCLRNINQSSDQLMTVEADIAHRELLLVCLRSHPVWTLSSQASIWRWGSGQRSVFKLENCATATHYWVLYIIRHQHSWTQLLTTLTTFICNCLANCPGRNCSNSSPTNVVMTPKQLLEHKLKINQLLALSINNKSCTSLFQHRMLSIHLLKLKLHSVYTDP